MIKNNLDIDDVTSRLRIMEDDPALITKSTFRVDSSVYPDNQMPFVDFHVAYLKQNQNINPDHYLSNLRIRIRRR